MPKNIHPVSDYIDINSPDFERVLDDASISGIRNAIVVKIWNPVIFKDGSYVSAVSIEGLLMPRLSAMPGDDKLDALLKAVAFVSDTLNQRGVVSTWAGKPLGGFPLL